MHWACREKNWDQTQEHGKRKFWRKLANGKILGGKDHLTRAGIDKFLSYYDLAIRRHPNNLDEI